jgi:peptidoglycan/xylan/chitin deacetylase (PgdA/CDA1 family)
MYPVNVRELRSHASLSLVPQGMIPVALTFDDGRKSQFKMGADGTLSSHCALGIFEDFINKHAPVWKTRATFYVMPKSNYNLEPFQQKGLAATKLKYLVEAGYEVGNHTWSHRSLKNMSSRQVASEVSRCYFGIRALCQRATMDTLCIPFGEYPRVPSWRSVLSNPLNQSSRMNSLVLMAWGGPSYSPFDKRFDCLRVTRIGVSPHELESTFQRLEHSRAWYVSGGDPGFLHIPSNMKKYVSESSLNGVRITTH